MDSNGNQRKRGIRISRNANANENPASQNVEQTEDKGISAVALSPSLEEPENVTNAPAAECRRSSRKKIIKFDVRDLLNKNRKTHKIQIEARIDSNAPTTSKAATTSVLETTNPKASSVAREDLLSKQKTFLEKSAIFRRYSISQEHKAPPPPLHIPPLLGKSSGNKEVGLSDASSTRRLSRTQEFFSNVMIKPKQTSSLIVAQIESNSPCSAPGEKLKSANMDNMTSSKIKFFQKPQQKRRGRPAKIKTQASVEPVGISFAKEKSAKKKVIPKKATNWKEYKACLAQQSISTEKQKESCKIDDKPMLSPIHQYDQGYILNQKQEEEKHCNDTLQSEILRSDDDGNFSGFQTSKDDLSCDSPILAKTSLEENISKGNKNAELCEKIQHKANHTREGIIEDIKIKSSMESIDNNISLIKKLTEADKILYNTPIPIDLKQHELQKRCCTESIENECEEELTRHISCKQEFVIENLKTVKTDSKVNAGDKPEVNTKVKNQVEAANKATNIGNEARSFENTELIKLKETANTTKCERNTPKQKSSQYKPSEVAVSQDVHRATSVHYSEAKLTNKNLIKTKSVELNKEETKVTTTNLAKNENDDTEIPIPTTLKDQQKIKLKSEIKCKDSKQEERCVTTAVAETSIKSKIIGNMHETRNNLKSSNNSSKSTQIVEENTDSKLSIGDFMLLRKQSSTQASAPSENTKSYSGTSSSSESENISERSSYSSESFTTSSSPRSYKSGDVLKVTVKRMSLPERSSTSSQTSTSEEFNYSSIHMRKSPMAKRSKRLQKKFEKTFKNEHNTENIDCCSKQIPSNDNRKIDEESDTTNITEPVKEEIAKCYYKHSRTGAVTNLISNESSNISNLSPKTTGVEETCLKNCKENCDNEVNEETDRKKSAEVEKCTIFKINVKEGSESLPNIQEITQASDEIVAHSQKSLACTESLTCEQSDSSEVIAERKKLRKIQSEEHLQNPSLCAKEQDYRTENKTELIMASEELSIKAENIITNNLQEIRSYKSAINRVKFEKNEAITTRSTLNKEGISTKDSKVREEMLTDLKSKDRNLNEKIEAETSKSQKNKLIGKSITTNQEKTNEMILAERKTTEESPPKKSKTKNENITEFVNETCLKDANASVKVESLESTQNKSKPPIQMPIETIKIPSTQIKRNDIEETNFVKKSIQSSRIESDQKEKSISEELIIEPTETSKSKIKSYEKSVAVDEEINAEQSERDRKKTSTKNKVNKDEMLAKEIVTRDENVTFGKIDARLKTNSAKLKRTELILEKTERKPSGRPRSRIKKSNEKLAITEEDAVSKNFENFSEIITTKGGESEKKKPPNDKAEYLSHSPTHDEISVNNELKSIETSIVKVDANESPKEDLFTIENVSYTTKNTTAKCETEEENLTKEIKDLEDDGNDILLKKSLEEIRSTSKHLKTNEKDIVLLDGKSISPNRKELRFVSDTNIKEQFTAELTSHSLLTEAIQEECAPDNLTHENVTTNQYFATDIQRYVKPHSSSKSLRKAFSQKFLNKSLPSKHAERSLELNLTNKSQECDNANETTQLLMYKSNTNKQDENILHKNKEQLLERNEPVTKTRSRKSRLKNRFGLKYDFETDSNNEKNITEDETIEEKLEIEGKISVSKEKMEKNELQQSPSKFLEADENVRKTQEDETIQEQQKIENKIPPSEKIEKKEIQQNPSTFLEAVENICQTKEKLMADTVDEESVSLQENSQANLLSSQIKNVSIETNTLLDILRTVQSNTEAALKANKSPIHMDKIESEVENKKPDLCIIQRGIKTISPTEFSIGTPLTVKKVNLSPTRSESNSPLSLKRVTFSPTRSNSLSPLTLKKVTRRYERRNHHGEDCTHKTLEETFAEIAEQSSKAVLTAKEFDVNDEQAANEKFEKRLDNINTGLSVENAQLNENFAALHKSVDLEEMPFNTKRQVDEYVSQDTVVSKEEIVNATKNVITVEAASAIPAKRGRKPKNRLIELPMLETKGTGEIKKSAKAKSETTLSKESGRMMTIMSETPKIADVETNFQNQLNKSDVNETLEDTQSSKLTEEKTKNLLISINDSLADSKLLPELTQTTDVGLLKPLEDVNENKSNKSNSKKREFKAAVEEDTLHCKGKEDEIQIPKQLTKKRDSSLNRTEAKPVSKKLPKQNKNEEEDSLNLEKEDTIRKLVAITPPLAKRGRKPKIQQLETIHQTTGSKKNNKKEACTKTYDDTSGNKGKFLGSESDSLNSSFEKSFEEKLAKKKRQKKLKEAFETVIKDDSEKTKDDRQTEISRPPNISNLDMTLINNSPPPENSQIIYNQEINEAIKLKCATPVEVEEDPDPLKDIEKFIADGVNLLKKDYKLEEDSVDDVVHAASCQTTEIVEEDVETSNEENKPVFNTFETPADTPLNTPSATPPPKSPASIEFTTPDENSGVRRSHRIKLITKTPKALVGRGLVRDKERFSIKDDVETKSHYTLDDHLMDLAEVEAKNAKFLKEMEERLSNFQVIKENEYLCERVISREARKMICDCFLTHEEEERGELGCGEDCLNRLLMIECGPDCNVKERCTNKRFQKFLCSPCRVFRTEKKGFGIMADIEILPGEFIMEYVGEVIDTDEFEKRRIMYSQDKNRHYYFMALRSDAIIDATTKGNISRFINHSCDPNAETQKWTVNGELRIGFFSRKSIMPGEEITFNYQYQRYGREAQRCYCESTNCRGWIGQEPTSDEGEQMDDDDEYDESDDDEEDADASNLLVQDDDEDSDASVADPEEVQKQLEMAAAQAEAELAPLKLLEEKVSHVAITANDSKSIPDLSKSDIEEDSKSKFKKLLSRMAEKVAAKQKQNKREQKLQRKKKSKDTLELTNKLRFSEDPDIEDEVQFLKECGLKNQSDTLRLSRLMVRAKLVETRLNLLEILRKGDFPCRRLFLDYHGLRLLHGWMSEDAENMQIRLSLLQTLETLPIANKTVLTDSKVMQAVRNWCGTNTSLSPNEDSSSSSQDAPMQGTSTFAESSEMAELQKLALKLITTWEGLPEIFRIPKKERIEQMKEHEREADRQYAANAETQENTFATDRYRRDRFNRGLNAPNSIPNRFVKPNLHRPTNTTTANIKNLSKAERREMFEAKVARDAAEKRLAEERREFETKCRFFGLDPKKTRAQDIPFCVNPATGQWFSIERKPITTPPSYAHVQVPIKPKSTDPNDYQLPAVCNSLPQQWKYAITPQGKIYYYHIKHRIPQWEPPSAFQLEESGLDPKEDDSESELTTTAGEDSSDDDDDILIGMDAAQLKAYIDRKVEMRRQKRYQRLVDERSISPRREEDRIYNQIEVRKYKENKEKIRKRKEDIRRKRAEALRQTSLNMSAQGNVADANTNKLNTESDEELGTLPIQDYLLSSDEEADLKAEVNSPLIDKIVEGDKIVDELDALTTKKQLKRPLPPHRDLSEPSTSSLSGSASGPITLNAAKPEHKKRKLEKKEKRKPKEQDAKYRKNKEKFRCEIAGIIVRHLKPYRKETCTLGRIQSNDDFNHLARKLTHFVMIKELKYCESVGQTLVVTESVKSKSREFIKKYMAKYGDVYVKPNNDPDFKDIPFTL